MSSPFEPGDASASLEHALNGAQSSFVTGSIVFSAAWLIFSWPWLSGAMTIPWDGKAQFAPQVQFMAASFARGEWPWWAPHVFAGQAQIADPQSMLFSPPMLALALFNSQPGAWAIDCTVLLMLLFAGLSVLLLARDLGWHWGGGLVAALVFAFGAAMAWRLQHFGQVFSLAYLPLTLFCLGRALDGRGIGYGATAGLLAGFIVLGRDQVALLCVYVLIGFVVAQWISAPNRLARFLQSLPALAAGGITGLAIVAVPIVMTLALADLSNRPSIDFAGAGAGSLHPALLITGVVPHLFGAAGEMADYWGPPSFVWENTGLFLAQNMGLVYIGALPLTLILAALLRGVLWEQPIRFYTIAFVCLLLYSLGWYTPVFRGIYELLPGVSFYRRPADAVFLIGALGALLAGYATSRFLQADDPAPWPWRWTVGIIIGLFVSATSFAVVFDKLWAAAIPLCLAGGCFATAAATLAVARWLNPIRPIAAVFLLVGASAGDIIWNNGPNGASALPSATLDMMNPAQPDPLTAKIKSLIAMPTESAQRDRVELIGLGYHWPNTSMTHGYDNTLGANPVRLSHYVAATGAGDTAGLGEQRKFTPLLPSYRSLMADLLGLRYVVTRQPIEQIDKAQAERPLPLVARVGNARIYENASALPRVMFAHQAQASDFATLMATGNWPDIDLRQTVLLEAPLSVSANPAKEPGNIVSVDYGNTRIIVRLASPAGGWVVLNDVWHPWWHAEIDGQPVQLLRANAIFRAVEVPPGERTVTFVFRPFRGAMRWLVAKSGSPGKGATK